MARILITLALVAACLWGLPSVLAPPAVAQTAAEQQAQPDVDALLDKWDAEAKLIEKRLEAPDLTTEELDSMRAVLDAQRAEIPGLVARTEEELRPLREQLEALGAPPGEGAEEPPDVARQRKELTRRIAALEGRLKRLAQADARAAGLAERIGGIRRHLFTQRLLTRGPSPLSPEVFGTALRSLAATAAAIAGEASKRAAKIRGGPEMLLRVALPLLLMGAALLLMLGVKRRALAYLRQRASASEADRPGIWLGLAMTLVRLVVPALALALALFAIWNSGVAGEMGRELMAGAAWAVAIVIGAYALGGAWYSPHTPELRLSRLPEVEARAAHRWLMALATVVGLDRMLVQKGEEIGLSIEALALLNAALLVLGGIALWVYAGFLARPVAPGADEEAPAPAPSTAEEGEDTAGEESEVRVEAVVPLLATLVRLAARLVAVLAPLLALLGYYAASRYVFHPPVLTGALAGVGLLLFHAVEDAVDRLAAPAPARAEEAGVRPSRLRLIPIAVAFFLLSAGVPVVALIWGAQPADLADAWRSFSQGFRIGEITIAPLDFFAFLAVFFIGYVITRIVEGIVSRSVLPYTALDVGAREAVRTGIFYLGVFVSALIAISATGLDLSNLAIVAGALSVGIGFGLQNIVNNFVSGLILLIERPIKPGDWVQLGAGSGYVRRVRVRSTEIETFDRATLIVPNSQLISETVTNWTHSNLHGRLIVPVGVAYGTDPRKVEEILLEIAGEHPMLLKRPAPYVLFRRFGADALEFELRAILRDVNYILTVHSELNYRIAERFAEEGIEIPFAQRDIHIRSTGDLGRAIGEGLRIGRGEARSGGCEGAGGKPRKPTRAPGPARSPRPRGEGGGEGEGGGDGP